MNLDVILKELLERSREVSKKLQENAVNDKEKEVELRNVKVQLEVIKSDVNDLNERLKIIERTKLEAGGFIKCTKLIWLAVAAIIGYLSK